MNFRQTAYLIGGVLVVGIVLLILTSGSDEKTPGTDILMEELAGVKAEDIDTVEFDRDGKTFKVVRADKEKNKWEIVEPYRVPADHFAINGVINALLKAKPTAYPELTGNPAVHGLEPPSLKVTLRGGEKSSTVNLGDVTIGGNKAVVFATTSARPKRPMAVPRGELDPLFKDPRGSGKAGDLARGLADFRVKSIFPGDSRAAGEDVTSIKLELPNKKKELVLARTLAGVWQFTSPAGWGNADSEGDLTAAPNSITGVRKLLGTLTTMSAGSAADFIDAPKDLKEYGLNADNPDLVKVEVKTRDNQSATVFLGKTEAPPAAQPPIPGMPPQSGKVFVRVEGLPGVIRATSGDLSGLAAIITDPAPMRDRTLVTADRQRVDGLDILLPGQPADKPTKLRRTGLLRQWSLYGGPGDPQTAAGLPVERILDVLLARRNIKDFPAPNPANFAAISATVFVYVDGFAPAPDPKTDPKKPDPKFDPMAAPKAEPVKKGEPIKLEFGRQDGDTIYVRRTLPGQPPNEFALPAQVKTGLGSDAADLLATVKKTRLELLDPALPTFSSESVTKVSVSGQNNYVLDRDEKPDPFSKEAIWRFSSPDPKGRTADTRSMDEMLRLLGTTQSVTRFVDEEPTEARLIDYGFKPNSRLKVVIDLKTDSPDKKREYEFGKDTADPGFVYARVPGKTAVFTLPRLVFDKLVNPDLRDRLIFRDVDAPKVNKLELKGWGHLGLGAVELTLEKNKDGIWTVVKGPQGFAVDPAKVTAFVDLLARSRAKTFEKGMPEGKHGFGDLNQYLQVTMYWPGGSVHMNIGASPDMGASYYLFSGWLPATDPVATIDGLLLKQYKEKPAAFGR